MNLLQKIRKKCTNKKGEIEKDVWRVPDEAIDLLDGKAIDFIFAQGEKYLEELCKVSDSITGRCYSLLGIIFAVCPFLVTTALSLHDPMFSTIAYLFAMICVGACVMLLLTMKPRLGYSKGRDPKDLTYEPFMKHYKENEIESYSLYELENLQWKIDDMRKANEQRSKTFTVALWTLLVSFCTLLVFAMIFISC